MSSITTPSESSVCQSPWEEDVVQFGDTDGDTNVIRLHNGAIDVEVNGRRLFHDIITCRIDGHTLRMQTASSKTVLITVPLGREEVVLRVMALMQRRHEASSIVEFHDTDGHVNLMRISPRGYLQLFVAGKMALADVLVCRFEGDGGRSISIKGAAARNQTCTRAAMTVKEEHQEVLPAIAKIFGKRGLQRNAVEFTDTHGDVYIFKLTELASLELYVNGKLLDHDLVEVRVEGYDGRMINCKGKSNSAAIVMTVLSGMQDWAISTLALFRLRAALRRGEQPSSSIFCAPALGSGRSSCSCVSKCVKFNEDGAKFWADGKTPCGSSTSVASSTRCSAVSSVASSRSSAIGEEIGIDLSLGLAPVIKSATAGVQQPARKPSPGRRKPVRHWLLRPPDGEQRDTSRRSSDAQFAEIMERKRSEHI